VTYLMVFVFTVSGITDSRLTVVPDEVSCVAESSAAKARAATVPGEWRLRTMCVPIPETVEV